MRREKIRAIYDAWEMIKPVISAKKIVINPQTPIQKKSFKRIQPTLTKITSPD